MEEKETNIHSMITRSKKSKLDNENDEKKIEYERVDSNGNLLDLIDDSEQTDFDNEMFQKELLRLRGVIPTKKTRSPTKKKKKNKGNLIDLILPYLFMNLFNKGAGELKKKKKPTKKKKLNIQEMFENENIQVHYDEELSSSDSDENNSDEEESIHEESTEEGDYEDDIMSDETEDEFDNDEEELNTSSGEDEEYDEYDDNFIELLDNDINEDEELHYFHTLETKKKEEHIDQLKQIKEINKSNIPLRFKILNSQMDLRTKSIAIENIEKLSEMDVSTGEYCKMDKWINGLIKIPFGKYNHLEINNENKDEEKKQFLYNTFDILDKAIYGHKDAKIHILQVIGKWIKNPSSQGNVLALQGPMGNGKTTLVKEGIAKAINRPFAFIALGGASDSSFFDGHSYTYEGSHWGRIIDILIESKCMNPIIYFDELDKISETHKGEEIIHLLTHLTDPSQNNLFQDNYFPGVHIDLSKALFIFSFNDESKVDRILKDRMYVINTKGFKSEDKIMICNNYILPELMNTFLFNKEDIVFEKEGIEFIIENYTEKEEGVRNLKRCLETIISKVNIYNLSHISNNTKDNIPLNFEIKDFKLPLHLNKEIIEKLISKKEDIHKPPENMYM